MKIVCFKGNANSGKSKTIKKILNEFFKIRVFSPKEKNDFCIMFPYKNKKIGICSYGDQPNLVIEKLTLFKKDGYDMIVCASHKRSRIIDFIKEQFEEHNIKFVDCNRGESQEEYDRRISIFKEELNKIMV